MNENCWFVVFVVVQIGSWHGVAILLCLDHYADFERLILVDHESNPRSFGLKLFYLIFLDFRGKTLPPFKLRPAHVL